jgi:hypothetical protein
MVFLGEHHQLNNQRNIVSFIVKGFIFGKFHAATTVMMMMMEKKMR